MSLARARWRAMHARCDNPKNKSYRNYGGRGIRVCERWKSFEVYHQDMGEPPPGMTLERIDNDGDYTPENCRWASRQDQAENKRNILRLEWAGMIMPLKEWCRRAGMHYGTVHRRLRTGIPWPQALYTPIGEVERPIATNGKWTEEAIQTIRALAANRVPRKAILSRYPMDPSSYHDIINRKTWRHVA